MATVTAIEYSGLIWCPTVSTGAFVARRNGKVFITGNSGFPKSLDVSKAIDKAAGAEREVVGEHQNPAGNKAGGNSLNMSAVGMPSQAFITAPATESARQWQGWGTALKPALEPITMARKPFKGTVADNVLAHGTGALNIDGCRVDFASVTDEAISKAKNQHADFDSGPRIGNNVYGTDLSNRPNYNPPGRWPANLLHDGSDEVVAGFPATGPAKAGMRGIGLTGDDVKVYGKGNPNFDTVRGHNDQGGSAARFFYCAKASKADRDEGLGHLPEKASTSYGEFSGTSTHAPKGAHNTRANHHPTVKPTDLMRYLVRLVTPPGGTVLDPFMGSGSTGKAALLEGFHFVGCEREAEYLAIANARIAHALQRTEAESQPGPLFA